jgi:hypothetical protein
MIDNCWLPKLEYLNDYKGAWINYENALYIIFKNDFIDSSPFFKNQKVSLRDYQDKDKKNLSIM